MMKYLFAGGGTGGHIFPAIAIADEIKILDPGAEILFVGAKGRIEEKIVPQNNYMLETITISGFNRAKILNNISLPYKIMKSLIKSEQIIRKFKPDVAVGTGGFVCGPVILKALRMGVPALIQEGNSFAGKTIKMLSRKANKVVINFDETKNYLKRKDNIIKISHPVRSSLKAEDRSESLSKFGLNVSGTTLFIFGGSQGARAINDAVINIIPALYEKNINVIWQTGETDFDRISEMFEDKSDRVKIYKFINDMSAAYSASDLIICRAGITSIMEIALLEKAAIIIPLPGSAEEHQVKNALSLKKLNAAEVIFQQDLGEKLLPEILRITGDKNIMKELQRNINGISDKGAAKKIAEEIIKLIKAA